MSLTGCVDTVVYLCLMVSRPLLKEMHGILASRSDWCVMGTICVLQPMWHLTDLGVGVDRSFKRLLYADLTKLAALGMLLPFRKAT